MFHHLLYISSICKGKHYLANGSLLVRLLNRVRHIFGGGLKISLESWMAIGKGLAIPSNFI
jgi:hypothetical protein